MEVIKRNADGGNLADKQVKQDAVHSAAKELGKNLKIFNGHIYRAKESMAKEIKEIGQFQSIQEYQDYIAGVLEIRSIDQRLPSQIQYNGKDLKMKLAPFIEQVFSSEHIQQNEQEFLMSRLANLLAQIKYQQIENLQNQSLEIDFSKRIFNIQDRRASLADQNPKLLRQQAASVILSEIGSNKVEQDPKGALQKAHPETAQPIENPGPPSDLSHSMVLGPASMTQGREPRTDSPKILTGTLSKFIKDYDSPETNNDEAINVNNSLTMTGDLEPFSGRGQELDNSFLTGIPEIPEGAEYSILDWDDMNINDLKRIFPEDLIATQFTSKADQDIKAFDYAALQKDLKPLSKKLSGGGRDRILMRQLVATDSTAQALMAKIKSFDLLLRARKENYKGSQVEKASRTKRAAVLVALFEGIEDSLILNNQKEELAKPPASVMSENNIPTVLYEDLPSSQNKLDPAGQCIIFQAGQHEPIVKEAIQSEKILKAIKNARASQAKLRVEKIKGSFPVYGSVEELREKESIKPLKKEGKGLKAYLSSNNLAAAISYNGQSYTKISRLTQALNQTLSNVQKNQKEGKNLEFYLRIQYNLASSLARVDYANKEVFIKDLGLQFFQKDQYPAIEAVMKELKPIQKTLDLKQNMISEHPDLSQAINRNFIISGFPGRSNLPMIHASTNFLKELDKNFDAWKDDIIKLCNTQDGCWAKVFSKIGVLELLEKKAKEAISRNAADYINMEAQPIITKNNSGSIKITMQRKPDQNISQEKLKDLLVQKLQEASHSTTIDGEPSNPSKSTDTIVGNLKHNLIVNPEKVVFSVSPQDLSVLKENPRAQKAIRKSTTVWKKAFEAAGLIDNF